MNPVRIKLRYDLLDNWQKDNGQTAKLSMGEIGIANDNGNVFARVGTSETPQSWSEASELSVFNNNQNNTQLVAGTGIILTQNTDNTTTISLSSDFIDLELVSGDGINVINNTNNSYQLSLSEDVLRNVNLSPTNLNNGDILIHENDEWVNKNLSDQIKTQDNIVLTENEDGTITLSSQAIQPPAEFVESSCGVHMWNEVEEKWYTAGVGVTGGTPYSCFYDEDKNYIWIGGFFSAINSYKSDNIGLWDNNISNFRTSFGVSGAGARIFSIEKFNDEIYFGGIFNNLTDLNSPDANSVRNIAKLSYNDETGSIKWEKVGNIGKLGGTNVRTLVSYSGKLYVYGSIFPNIEDCENVEGPIITWDGTQWEQFISTPSASIEKESLTLLGVIDNELYFSGLDLSIPKLENNYVIYKWNGNEWFQVGGNFPSNFAISSLGRIAKFNSELYVNAINNYTTSIGTILKLNNQSNQWEVLSPNITGFIRSIKSNDNFLYAIGSMKYPQNTDSSSFENKQILRYNGNEWSELPPDPVYSAAGGLHDLCFIPNSTDDDFVFTFGGVCRSANNIAGTEGPYGGISSIDPMSGSCCRIFATSYRGNTPGLDLEYKCVNIKNVYSSNSEWFYKPYISDCPNGPDYDDLDEPRPNFSISFITNKSKNLIGFNTWDEGGENPHLVSHPYWPFTKIDCKSLEDDGTLRGAKGPQRPFCDFQYTSQDGNIQLIPLNTGYTNLVWLTNVDLWTASEDSLIQSGKLSGWFPNNIVIVEGDCAPECPPNHFCEECPDGTVICKCLLPDENGDLVYACPTDPCGEGGGGPGSGEVCAQGFNYFIDETTNIDQRPEAIRLLKTQQSDDSTDPIRFMVFFPNYSYKSINILADFKNSDITGIIIWDKDTQKWKTTNILNLGQY